MERFKWFQIIVPNQVATNEQMSSRWSSSCLGTNCGRLLSGRVQITKQWYPLSGRKERKVSSSRIVADIYIVGAFLPWSNCCILTPATAAGSRVLTFGLVTRGNVTRKWEINVTVFRNRVSSGMFCGVLKGNEYAQHRFKLRCLKFKELGEDVSNSCNRILKHYNNLRQSLKLENVPSSHPTNLTTTGYVGIISLPIIIGPHNSVNFQRKKCGKPDTDFFSVSFFFLSTPSSA